MLTDTHAHLYWDSFQEDFNQVIKRSLDAGVSTIINVGVDIQKSQEALRQTQQELSNIEGLDAYSSIGIHPHEALRYAQGKLAEDIDKLEQIYLSAPKKVVAIGECGLDYFFQNNPGFIPPSLNVSQVKKLQQQLFQAQINLAKKLNLPLIVHSRDDRSHDPNNSECWDKIIDMTKDHFGIYHCYSGLEQITKRVIEKTRFLISFAATLTYPKNDYLREAVKILPLDRIVLETDCPFLPPQNKRGQRNEPATIAELAELITQLKGLPFDVVANQTTKNAQKLFKIGGKKQDLKI